MYKCDKCGVTCKAMWPEYPKGEWDCYVDGHGTLWCIDCDAEYYGPGPTED